VVYKFHWLTAYSVLRRLGMTNEVLVAEKFAAFQMEAMSNLRSNRTGAKGAVIWISYGEYAGADMQHGPRIKVALGDRITSDSFRDSVTVTITQPPKFLGDLPGGIKRQITKFLDLNRQTLLDYWSGDLDTGEVLDRIKPI
jgi:hypothetical protein